MSQSVIAKIKCPHCEAVGEFEIWQSVNVLLDPELRDRIFDEELFMYHCPHCGRTTGVPFGFLYNDVKNRFMIFFEHFKPDNYDYAPIDTSQLPIIGDDYVFRTVYGLRNLKEKIRILECELNDVAIERHKYMITHHMFPEFTSGDWTAIYFKVSSPTEEERFGKIHFIVRNEDTSENFEISTSMEAYYKHCKACEIDPRMAVKGCMCIDEEWVGRQMKKDK